MIRESEQRVYDLLEKLNIQYVRHEHPPVYTVEEANKYYGNIDGAKCKNLFIRNRKGNKHYLVIMVDSKKVDLKSLADQINSTSLSFASERRLEKYLGVKPGSVTPFGLINDSERAVEVLLDMDLASSQKINFHPNVNTATVTISYRDFERFLEWCGNKISYIKV